MSDFTSEFWSWFIIAIVGGGIVWLFYLLRGNNKAETEQGVPTGHVWDEDFSGWNQDCDYWETLKKKGVKSVINPRSRVDHLWAPISGHMQMTNDWQASCNISTENFKRKWNK